MRFSGVTADIECFTNHPSPDNMHTGEFADRFFFFSELAALSLGNSLFTAEIGAREAFGNPRVLHRAVFGFQSLKLFPRLFTTGVHFGDRENTLQQLRTLGEIGVRQIHLRVNAGEAAQLSSDCVRNLAEGCELGGIDLRLQFELTDSFTDDCCRITRTVEDSQINVTVLPVRLRPTRLLRIADASPVSPGQRIQLLLGCDGDVTLRLRKQDEFVDILAGNARDCALSDIVNRASQRL